MASLCTRCALRFRHVAASDTPSTVRSFSSTTTRSAHAIPKFTETSNEELDDVLASMRNKHFVPAALTPAQRRLIFGDKNREEMTKHPRTIEIAGEPIELKWMDRRKEIPNRTKLFRSAIRLMTEDGSREAWGNLLQLLVGLKRSGVEITDIEVARILRAALQTGHFGAILSCLRRGDETGITLQRPEVLDAILLGLRRHAQKDEWRQENIDRAIKEGRDVAQLLESEMHGGGKVMKENDLRRDPRVIGVFLELSAMFAARHQDGKDVDGRVRAYSERLLANLEGAKELTFTQPAEKGPQSDIILSISICHGLKLAQKILGPDMPNAMLAEEVKVNYERSLASLVKKLESQNPDHSEGGYVDQALRAWRECRQD